MAYEYETREKKSLGCMTSTMRWFLMLINFLFILVSIAGVAVGALLHEGKDDGYLRFCEPCKQFQLFLIVVFAALFVFSSVGFCALWKRNSCLLLTYGFFLVIFFLISTVITVVIFMVHDGHFDDKLKSAWEDEAKTNEDNSLCKFQYDMKCSGWDVLCPVTNATYSWSNYSSFDKINCPDCTGTQYIDQIRNRTITDETCHNVLKSDVNKYYYILLGAGFGLMMLCILSIIVSCKIRVQYEDAEAEYERF